MALDRMRRPGRVLVVSSLLVLAVALAGCIEVAMESEFDSDGSARHSLSTLVDRSLLDDEMLGEELDFDEIEQEGRDAGLDVERVDDGERVGVRMSMDVDDNDDLGRALNQLFNATDTDGPEINAFSGSFTQSGGGFGGTTYRFELTVDGDALFEDEEDEFDDEFGMGMEMMRQFINMTYTVNMPGEITDHNGNDLGGGRIQWDLPFEGSQTFFVESEEGSGFPLALILGVGVGFVALILVVVGGLLLMRGRSAPQPAPAASPVGGAPLGTPLSTHPMSETETHRTSGDGDAASSEQEPPTRSD
jgi:hypothetical protein